MEKKEKEATKKHKNLKRVICLHCGNYHLVQGDKDIEEVSAWCAEQDRISIQAEQIEFYDKWL